MKIRGEALVCWARGKDDFRVGRKLFVRKIKRLLVSKIKS